VERRELLKISEINKRWSKRINPCWESHLQLASRECTFYCIPISVTAASSLMSSKDGEIWLWMKKYQRIKWCTQKVFWSMSFTKKDTLILNPANPLKSRFILMCFINILVPFGEFTVASNWITKCPPTAAYPPEWVRMRSQGITNSGALIAMQWTRITVSWANARNAALIFGYHQRGGWLTCDDRMLKMFKTKMSILNPMLPASILITWIKKNLEKTRRPWW